MDLYLLLGMNGPYQIGDDSGPLGPPHIRKQLVPYKKRVLRASPHKLHGLRITRPSRFPCFEDIPGAHLTAEALHSGLLVVGQKRRGESQPPQLGMKRAMIEGR